MEGFLGLDIPSRNILDTNKQTNKLENQRIWKAKRDGKDKKNIKQTKNTKGQKIPKLETKKGAGEKGEGKGRSGKDRQAMNHGHKQKSAWIVIIISLS